MMQARLRVCGWLLGVGAGLGAYVPQAKAVAPHSASCLYSLCESSGNVVGATVLAQDLESGVLTVRVDMLHVVNAEQFITPEPGELVSLPRVTKTHAEGEQLLLVSYIPRSPEVDPETYPNYWFKIPYFDGETVGCMAEMPEWAVPLESFLGLMRFEGECQDFKLPNYRHGLCQSGSTEMALWGLSALGLLLWRRQRASRYAA